MPPRMKVTMKRGREAGEVGDGGSGETAADTEAKRPRVAKEEPAEPVAEIEGHRVKFTMRRDGGGSGDPCAGLKGVVKRRVLIEGDGRGVTVPKGAFIAAGLAAVVTGLYARARWQIGQGMARPTMRMTRRSKK